MHKRPISLANQQKWVKHPKKKDGQWFEFADDLLEWNRVYCWWIIFSFGASGSLLGIKGVRYFLQHQKKCVDKF